ncbi:MAG: redox-sensing transcriptional repressor Rex [Candidatus Omnitrophica bacterium CG11_big_fil_rev_8_21_14_0_20_42_13]|uniref:Redox-sensing transcriptional repressor Rex n=1 Tax=Candidatus Ghiorseimicrobium undicola TaxID=1974746 RepID=A0A2H0LY44_9BACT|nr:MAG: redox-sensing transcriptional repressor Rex [Candidatus Omnitrophica bacterium CG11_big_fil_rev_8_21_14_0_20_42_13]
MINKVPQAAVPRLSLYYRALLESRGKDYVSSDELSKLTNFTAAQVRRDLTYFGQFGTPGKGYEIEGLKKAILGILGTDKNWDVALVGAGNLGTALLSYKGFKQQGFKILSAFDNDLRKIGKTLEGITVQDISELEKTVSEQGIQIAIVATSTEGAQEVIDTLIRAGVKAILNFTPIRAQTPEEAIVLNIDLSIELERLAYFLTKAKA